jgi:small subunit ribosomal protein S1
LVIVAKHAGFCFGVKRAVGIARSYAPCFTLGEITHNRQVVAELEGIGVRAVSSPEEVPEGAVCVIRSHGAAKGDIERLAAKNVAVVDATCPKVSRIHEIAQRVSGEGRHVFVAGTRDHPEVIGILGWCGGMGISAMAEEDIWNAPPCERPALVSQTTLSEGAFSRLAKAFLEKYPDGEVFPTRCSATRERQSESVSIASRADVMLVVGSPHSANTKALYTLCKAVCPRTYCIESARELSAIPILPGDRIGLTTGASTPDCTFKEVVSHMNDIEKKDQLPDTTAPQESTETTTEEDFMADVEKSLVQLRPGQTVTGTVLLVTDEEVSVNVGYKADGLIKISDLSSTDVRVGDEIEVEVVKVNDGDGNVLLSQKNLVNRKNWEEIVAKYEAGEFVQGTGKEAVKGGLIATVNDIRCFIPASHLALHYVEKIQNFVGQELTLKIIELDRAKKRLVASRKEVLKAEEAERKKAIWETLSVGAIVSGTVRRLTDFGAFVDIGGVDGLVHVTDLAWYRVKHPSDVVSVKQQIDVEILKLDPERDRISLSYKATQPKPWDTAAEKYREGMVVEGKVVRITTFGAFVELEPGLDGLVHISQCALTRIAKVEDAVKVGEIVRVKVLGVNPEAKRISLSIRAVKEDEAFEGVDDVANFSIKPLPVDEIEMPEIEELPEDEAEAPEIEELPADEPEAPEIEELPEDEAEAPEIEELPEDEVEAPEIEELPADEPEAPEIEELPADEAEAPAVEEPAAEEPEAQE